MFTGLLFCAYVGIHQVRTLVFDNYQRCPMPLRTFSNDKINPKLTSSWIDMLCFNVEDTATTLFRANTSSKDILNIVVPASLLLLFILHTVQSFKHHSTLLISQD